MSELEEVCFNCNGTGNIVGKNVACEPDLVECPYCGGIGILDHTCERCGQDRVKCDCYLDDIADARYAEQMASPEGYKQDI